MPKSRVAVLDDYQDVALQMTDWSSLSPDTDIQVFFVDSEPVAAPGAARMGKAL